MVFVQWLFNGAILLIVRSLRPAPPTRPVP